MQKTYWFRTNKRYSRNRHILDYISPHCDLDLEDRIPFFRMTFRIMVVHHKTKFGYKRSHTNTQLSGNKYVSQALHSPPLKTTQCFPFCSKIIHHTAQKEVKRCCRKTADVDWYVRVGRKSMVQAEIIILCARTLHHCKTPHQPPLKKLL